MTLLLLPIDLLHLIYSFLWKEEFDMVCFKRVCKTLYNAWKLLKDRHPIPLKTTISYNPFLKWFIDVPQVINCEIKTLILIIPKDYIQDSDKINSFPTINLTHYTDLSCPLTYKDFNLHRKKINYKKFYDNIFIPFWKIIDEYIIYGIAFPIPHKLFDTIDYKLSLQYQNHVESLKFSLNPVIDSKYFNLQYIANKIHKRRIFNQIENMHQESKKSFFKFQKLLNIKNNKFNLSEEPYLLKFNNKEFKIFCAYTTSSWKRSDWLLKPKWLNPTFCKIKIPKRLNDSKEKKTKKKIKLI